MWILVDDKLTKVPIQPFTKILTFTSPSFRIQISLTLSSLKRLVAFATKIGHASNKSTGIATSKPRNTSLLNGFCGVPTSSHPKWTVRPSNANLLLGFSVDTTVR